jgi:hypothetical protein
MWGRLAPQPALEGGSVGWRSAHRQPPTPQVEVLPSRPPLLDPHTDRPVRVGPGAQLPLGEMDVVDVAEDVDEPIAAFDAEVRRVDVGDVVVEADQM